VKPWGGTTTKNRRKTMGRDKAKPKREKKKPKKPKKKKEK
jgi:hypothetical protein